MCILDSLHSTLLDDTDLYLVSLLQPLADRSDNLSDVEIEKLPLRLQYYEGTRVKSLQLREKLIDALYQLCNTRHSREHLRKRGVYGILRELDRSMENDEQNSTPTCIGGDGDGVKLKLLTSQQHSTLHTLIGILICDEDDISNDSDFKSNTIT
ncbi:hypothetical protein DICVIV_03118 [Dictyocaulus viviparus]|uniref:Protein HGH1 C-terminal domain-containing protein n=1 Tax=Dictyocaulus viviparus TaxID=29172 RepID=A0A0D8Y872_DICVI|nr:hypothetical protein DICVIV_03118 [Dictyocaulus viviparus]